MPLKWTPFFSVMDHCFISFEFAQIEIELKWKKKGWKYTWPQAQSQCNPMVSLQDLVSAPISCYYIQLVKCTSISKLLKFGRKKPISLFINFVAQRLSILKKTTSICKVEHCFPTISNDNHPLFMMKHTFDIMTRHTILLALSHCFYS